MGVIDIPSGETGTIRVFSLSMSGAEARRLRQNQAAQVALLGAATLDSKGLELFPLSDLGDIGLAGYLREGIDAQEADLKRDRAKLAALDGWVMLVHSSAFDGSAQQLSPDPTLTLIGTYTQTPPDNAVIELTAETAKPTATPATNEPAQTKPTRASGSLMIVISIAIAAVILWWALN